MNRFKCKVKRGMLRIGKELLRKREWPGFSCCEHTPENIDETMRTSVWTAGFRAELQTLDIPITKQEC
jgi:hypothetical protein